MIDATVSPAMAGRAFCVKIQVDVHAVHIPSIFNTFEAFRSEISLEK